MNVDPPYNIFAVLAILCIPAILLIAGDAYLTYRANKIWGSKRGWFWEWVKSLIGVWGRRFEGDDAYQDPWSSNGRTAGFESVNGGSNPPRGTKVPNINKKKRRSSGPVNYNRAAGTHRTYVTSQIMDLIYTKLFSEGGPLQGIHPEDLSQRIGCPLWQAEQMLDRKPIFHDLPEMLQAAKLDLGIIMRDKDGNTQEIWPEINLTTEPEYSLAAQSNPPPPATPITPKVVPKTPTRVVVPLAVRGIGGFPLMGTLRTQPRKGAKSTLPKYLQISATDRPDPLQIPATVAGTPNKGTSNE